MMWSIRLFYSFSSFVLSLRVLCRMPAFPIFAIITVFYLLIGRMYNFAGSFYVNWLLMFASVAILVWNE